VFKGGILRGNLRVKIASYDIAVESYNGTVIGHYRWSPTAWSACARCKSSWNARMTH
jgi:hypothetical protein